MNLKLEEICSDIAKGVAQLDHNYSSLNTKVDIIATTMTKVVEFYTSLISKVDMKVDCDSQSVTDLKELLGNLKKLSFEVGTSSSSLITPESLSQKFMSLESTIKVKLPPLMKFINLMPTNSPLVHTKVQGEERSVGIKTSVGMGLSKVTDSGSFKNGDDGKVAGKVMLTQIPISLPKATISIISTSIKTRLVTKGVVIGSSIGGSSSKSNPSIEKVKGKGKGINVEPNAEEKKIPLENETEKQRKIQSILSQRQSDPPGLEKGDPTKHYCYDTIKASIFSRVIHEFDKVPKKSYATENTDFNQLDFPMNEMMFMAAQYQIIDKFEDKEVYKRLMIRFHAVLGKKEEVWSLLKIVSVLNISKDVLFEGVIQSYRFHVVCANNVAFDFSIAYFSLMNLHDLICVAKILKGVDVSKLQMTNKADFFIGFVHKELFIDNYYDCLVMTDVDLALAICHQVTVPQSMLKGQRSLKSFEEGEICVKPMGIVFKGKNKKGKNIKFLFQVCDVKNIPTLNI